MDARWKDVYKIDYEGTVVKLRMSPNREYCELVGFTNPIDYVGRCPNCQRKMGLSVKLHSLRGEGDLLSAYPTVKCPHDCGFHVWVTDGKAIDFK